MRIRFYPKTDVVKNMLRLAVEHETSLLNEEETKLAKLNSSIVKLPGDHQIDGLSKVQLLRESTQYLKDKLTLLDSHSPPEVMAEIDL